MKCPQCSKVFKIEKQKKTADENDTSYQVNPLNLPQKRPSDFEGIQVALSQNDIRNLSIDSVYSMLLEGSITRHFYSRQIKPKPNPDPEKSDFQNNLILTNWKLNSEWRKIGERMPSAFPKINNLYKRENEGSVFFFIFVFVCMSVFICLSLYAALYAFGFELPRYDSGTSAGYGVKGGLIAMIYFALIENWKFFLAFIALLIAGIFPMIPLMAIGCYVDERFFKSIPLRDGYRRRRK